MANYICKHCGTKMSSVSALTSNSCTMNPNHGKHVLYEGSEKSEYTCKHCGTRHNTFSTLVHNSCTRNPNGKYHEPSI